MVIYEIEAVVEKELIEAFEQYMSDRHMPGLIRTGYFESAEFNETMSGTFVIRYKIKDRATLNEYLETKAQALRKDFAKNFPTGIELTRRIIDPEENDKALETAS